MEARELAYNIIFDVLENGKYSSNKLNKALNQYGYLDKKDRSFITRLSEGTIEKKLTLDFVINYYSKIRINKMRPVIRNILRLGTYQILYMDQVPNSAAVNESVKLTKKKKFIELSGFVNGVLRTISNNANKLPESLFDSLDTTNKLSVKYSVPTWIVDKYLGFFGELVTEQLLEGYNTDNKISIRCNLSKCNVNELVELLESEGVVVEKGEYFDYAFKISNFDRLQDLSAFKLGYFQVQDESSMFVGHIGLVKKDMFILDVCAAPGGKSLHYADRLALEGPGVIEARDFSDTKLQLIKDNTDRCEINLIKLKQADATILDEEMIEKADLVLADLPCSGLGILSKKPDIRYHMSEEKQEELVKLQKKILTNVVKYVKPGGYLIYSTCTINKAENENMTAFITNNLGLKSVDLTEKLPKNLKCNTAIDGFIQLLPGIHKTDGFFISMFKKEIKE